MRSNVFSRYPILSLALVSLLAVATGSALANSGQGGGADQGQGPATHIVVFADGVDSTAAAADLAERHGLQTTHVYSHALSGAAFVIPADKADDVRGDSLVASLEPNQRVHAFEQALPTGIDRVEADKNSTAAIDNSPTAVDVYIAVIYTGIDLDHPDLNVYASTDCTGGGPFNSSCTDGEGDDGNGHGTHVAGTAAAIDDDSGVVGMAPGARLWAVKVLSDDGSGWMSDIIAGIDWVTAENGDGDSDEIEVANMSLGASDTWSDDLRTAITNSVKAGIVYAVAAGNDSEDIYGGDGTIADGNETIPAAYPEVAAISALADSDGAPGGNGSDTSYGSDDSFASFSNYSEAVVSDNPVSSPGAAIDLLMPGVDILSTWNDGGTNTISGTSMSSPHAAGLAALHIVANALDPSSDTDVYDIRQALIDNGVAQDSSDGLATLNDPDDNWENIGWADSGSPSVSWINPSDGDTVSGSVTIKIGASDSEDADDTLDVDWRVDGGTWQDAAWDSDCNCYTDSWDSTGVSDGDHTLDARAADSDSNSSTATITVTTENTDDAPTVSWVNPNDGDTVSGTVDIKIDASDDRDSGSDLTVEWQVDDGTWQTATFNSDSGYYEDSWDSTGVSDGDHNLDARATDTGDNTSSEARITVTVDNSSGAPTVDSLSLSENNSGGSPHAEFDASWDVGDSDGDLDTVDLTLYELDSNGNRVETEDSASIDVSGSDASGTTELKAKFDENSGKTYEVELVVTDTAGNTTSDSATEVEDGS